MSIFSKIKIVTKDDQGMYVGIGAVAGLIFGLVIFGFTFWTLLSLATGTAIGAAMDEAKAKTKSGRAEDDDE